MVQSIVAWLKNITKKWWFPILTAGLATVATLIVTSFSTVLTTNIAQKNETRQAALKSFQDVAYGLEPLGQKYIQAELGQDKALIEEYRNNLLTNISHQVAAAKKLEPYVNDPNEIRDYMDAVIKLKNAIIEDYPIEEMKPYWQAKQEVLLARDAIVKPKS